jgi:trk system potassium uptake protein
MKIIICGAGQVGWQIARQLASEGNDLVGGRQQPGAGAPRHRHAGGAGRDRLRLAPDVLEEAGARDADMVIAATFRTR